MQRIKHKVRWYQKQMPAANTERDRSKGESCLRRVFLYELQIKMQTCNTNLFLLLFNFQVLQVGRMSEATILGGLREAIFALKQD